MESKKGFTLVEGLVAIAMLVLAITFVLDVVQDGLRPLEHSRAQVTAVFLAQEAVETVRSMRDVNFLESRDWLYGLDECIDGVCEISVFGSPLINECSDGICKNLRYDNSTGRYGYNDGWSESEFVRETKINEESIFGRATVVVKVKWSTGELNMKETLYEFQ